MSPDLGSEGRGVAVITGAAGGLGRACAVRLGRHHRLVLTDLNAEPLDAFVAELATEGIQAEGLAGDVRAPELAGQLAAAVGDDRLAAVVCAAGLSSHMAPGDVIFTVNLVGTARVLDALLPLAQEGTVAVCIASISGHRGGVRNRDELMAEPLREGVCEDVAAAEGEAWTPGLAYALSKRGVIVHVERQARAWGDRGARIVSLSPGLIDTPMGRFEAAQGGGNAKQLAALSALNRGSDPDEVAAVVEFLCGPAAAYVTGTDICVDGGTTAELAHHSSPEVVAGWHRPGY